MPMLSHILRITTAAAVGLAVLSLSVVDGQAARRDHRANKFGGPRPSISNAQGGITLGGYDGHGGFGAHETKSVRPAPSGWPTGTGRDHR